MAGLSGNKRLGSGCKYTAEYRMQRLNRLQQFFNERNEEWKAATSTTLNAKVNPSVAINAEKTRASCSTSIFARLAGPSTPQARAVLRGDEPPVKEVIEHTIRTTVPKGPDAGSNPAATILRKEGIMLTEDQIISTLGRYEPACYADAMLDRFLADVERAVTDAERTIGEADEVREVQS